ncbi:MAG: NTP pyrophosphohydrolase [Planctomycetota bacterium]|nr:MAG: NTP pyrophosphohydrolase [Planctomycetota bacterium]
MSDKDTSVAELREIMHQFVQERDWNQFHSPKNLSMAIAIEAAELMEHFQWQDVDAARDIRESPEDMRQVREELADIVAYVVSFANALDIDISTALREKMIKNAQKYPAAEFRGRFRRSM